MRARTLSLERQNAGHRAKARRPNQNLGRGRGKGTSCAGGLATTFSVAICGAIGTAIVLLSHTLWRSWPISWQDLGGLRLDWHLLTPIRRIRRPNVLLQAEGD